MSVESLITKHIDIWTSAVQNKSSAGRGSSKKIDLYGIKKLRELILELAVRGKLVPQDLHDEPASVLLERIAREKLQLIKEKKVKKHKNLAEITQDDTPFEIPKSWRWVRFPDVANYAPGKTPSTKNSLYWDEGAGSVPWVSIADLNDSSSVTKTTKRISQHAQESVFKTNPLPVGTMLMSFKLTVGKISILDIEAFHNEAIISIFPYKGIVRDYLFRVLPSRANSGNKKQAIMGYTLNAESLSLLMLPIPPEQEQHRIVAKVDELMKLCDQLEQQTEASIAAHQVLVETLLATLTNSKNAEELMENWLRISAHFDTLFTTEESIDQLEQTILQLAVMGKLVPQNPADEPASELLKRIAQEKVQLVKEKKIKKQKALPPITDDEKPFELPDGWECTMLDDIFVVTGGLQKTPKRAPVLNHYPYLAVANVQRGKLELDDLKRFEVTDDELERYKLEFGDLMVVEGNGSDNEIGRCAIWQGEIDNCLHQNHLIRCRPLLSEISGWVLQTLNSPFGINEMKTLAVTSSGLYNLSVGKIRSVHIPIPPLDEQSRIVSKTRELITICDQLKAHIHEVQKGHLKLTDAIVEQSI